MNVNWKVGLITLFLSPYEVVKLPIISPVELDISKNSRYEEYNGENLPNIFQSSEFI